MAQTFLGVQENGICQQAVACLGREVTFEWLLLVLKQTSHSFKVKPGHFDLSVADIDDKVRHQLAVKAG